MLKPVEINTSKEPADFSVIVLHGLGASGQDFIDIVPALALPPNLKVRFIFPYAPVKPIAIFNQQKMRAWFNFSRNFADNDFMEKIDVDGINTSNQLIESLIAEELNRGVKSERILLSGFSQGAVMALHTGLCYCKPLAGIMALSGFYAESAAYTKLNPANKNIKILLAHGNADQIVPIDWARSAYQTLLKSGYNVTLQEYPIAHNICQDEIHLIRKWLIELASVSCLE
jgi:phospholipase/carboxylesterase